jgi:signal transduction histidine kinase
MSGRMIRGVVVPRALSTALALDWLPVLAVPPVLIVDAAVSSYGNPLTAVNVLAAFVGCLPLAARRHLGFPALAPLLTAGIIFELWRVHPASTVVLIPMIALFELALGGDRRRSLWMGVATVPCVVVSVLPFATASNLAPVVISNLALCLLAIVGGDLVRARRLSAERLLDAREAETLRRVGEERLRIAHEIHDLVAHAMTAINVQAGVAAHLLDHDSGQVHDALRAIKDVSGEALDDLRATLNVLRDPSRAAPLGPTSGLADLAPLTDGLRAAGVAVAVEIEPVGDVPAAVQSAGYRIVQEALTNVARHAAASRARVSVSRVPGAVRIEVVDDGPAATADAAAVAAAHGAAATGNGVRGMRERAVALGGTLEAAPAAAGGWRVQAELPVSAPGSAALDAVT